VSCLAFSPDWPTAASGESGFEDETEAPSYRRVMPTRRDTKPGHLERADKPRGRGSKRNKGPDHSKQRIQNSRHGENIQLIGEGHGDGHSGRSALHRCRSTTCRVSSRGMEASRGHRLRRLNSRRCSHVPEHFQHSRCAKTIARQQTWLAGSPPMSGVLESHPSTLGHPRISDPPSNVLICRFCADLTYRGSVRV
jgi:hypothetical protein